MDHEFGCLHEYKNDVLYNLIDIPTLDQPRNAECLDQQAHRRADLSTQLLERCDTEKRPPEKGFARNRKLVIGAVTRGALSLRGDETCEPIGPWSRQPAGVSLPQPSVDFERCNQSTPELLSPLVELGVITKGATMKYVVADSRGRILKVDASRCSEAVNWARNRLSGAPSVSKVPEVLKVVGDDPDQVLLVADEETAKVDGWWKGPAGRLQHAR